MTEAEEKIEVLVEEKVEKRNEPSIYKKAMIHPHLPLEHFQICGFSEPIFVFDENSPEYKSEYDLKEFDLLEFEKVTCKGQIAYEDILLQKMMAIYNDKREDFIVYQANIHNDPKLWLTELRRFWENFRKHIVELEDKEFYDEYLVIIDKVSKRKMKKDINFKWGGKQVSLVELAIALYELGVIEINKDAYSVTKFIEAFANAMNFEIDNTTANNYKTKIIGKTTKGVVDEKDLDFFNELRKVFTDWLRREREK